MNHRLFAVDGMTGSHQAQGETVFCESLCASAIHFSPFSISIGCMYFCLFDQSELLQQTDHIVSVKFTFQMLYQQ